MKNKHAFFLCAIVLFAFILRFYHIDKYGIWADEEYSVLEANGFSQIEIADHVPFTLQELQSHNTFASVVSSCIKVDGGNGIVYTIILHYWSGIFSNTDCSIRMLSLLMGLLSVIISYFLSIELFGNKNAALFTAFLVALTPVLVGYSQVSRAYMTAVFFSSSASLFFFKIVNHDKTNFFHLLWYALAAALSLLSHYSTIYILAAHLIIALYFRISLKKWICLSGCALAAAGLFFFWLLNGGLEGLQGITTHNLAYTKMAAQNPGDSFVMATNPSSILKGWIQNMLSLSGNGLQMTGLQLRDLFILLIIPGGIFYFVFKATAVPVFKRRLAALSVLIVSSMVYATVLALKAGHIISFQTLYSIFSVPYCFIIIGFSLVAIPALSGKWKPLALKILLLLQLALMVASITFIYKGYGSWTKDKNRFVTTAEKINLVIKDQPSGNFRIIYHSAKEAIMTNLYLSNDAGVIVQMVDPASQSGISLIQLQNGIEKSISF
jgi:uncharacterized membrane protein